MAGNESRVLATCMVLASSFPQIESCVVPARQQEHDGSVMSSLAGVRPAVVVIMNSFWRETFKVDSVAGVSPSAEPPLASVSGLTSRQYLESTAGARMRVLPSLHVCSLAEF